MADKAYVLMRDEALREISKADTYDNIPGNQLPRPTLRTR
jgi:hypothetical protein